MNLRLCVSLGSLVMLRENEVLHLGQVWHGVREG